MYQFKQDLAMAYFDGCSKKTASRLLAREINLIHGLLDALILPLSISFSARTHVTKITIPPPF